MVRFCLLLTLVTGLVGLSPWPSQPNDVVQPLLQQGQAAPPVITNCPSLTK